MRTRLGFALPPVDELDRFLATRMWRLDRGAILLLLCIVVYAAFFSALTILRHWSFETHAWDLGIFTQSLWTTVHENRFLYHTTELFMNPSGSFFGVHFSPLLLAFLPLYWLAPLPEVLLIFQAFALAAATVPIYLLAKNYVGGRVAGLVFSIAYLIFPAVHYVNLYEFHVQAFLPFLLAFTVYFLTKENWRLFFPLLLISLMAEEHVALILGFLGVYMLWKYKSSFLQLFKNRTLDKRLLISLTTIALCAIWYLFTLWQRDTFFPINPSAISEFLGAGNFETLGASSPLEVPFAVVLHPTSAFQALVNDGAMKLLYFALLFAPLAFLPFASASLLLPTIPNFMFSLISDAKVHHMLGVHYEAYTIPFIFAAGIFTLAKVIQRRGIVNARRWLKVLMVFSVIFFVVASPVGPVVSVLYPQYASVSYGNHEGALTELLATIPPEAPILTQNNIFPHVSNRGQAYVIPSIHLNTGVRELAINFTKNVLNDVEYVLVDSATDKLSSSFALELLANRTDFHLEQTKDSGSILLYHRNR